jgi:hypothetical protein
MLEQPSGAARNTRSELKTTSKLGTCRLAEHRRKKVRFFVDSTLPCLQRTFQIYNNERAAAILRQKKQTKQTFFSSF